MRLLPEQIVLIKQVVAGVLNAPGEVWLFGSRADDTARGGDIDLFVETQILIPNRAEMLCKLYAALIRALGDRKIDLILKDGRTADAPIYQIARQTGVRL